MKVLHCIPGMGGGGAERQLSYLAGPLRDLGWQVHVALTSGGPNLARLQEGGALIHRLSPAGNHDPRLAWQIAAAIRRVEPDVVQVWFVQMEVLAGLAAELLRVPWILSERSVEAAYPRSWKNWLRVRFAATADAIVANSAAGDAYWRERLGDVVPRFVVPNAIPLDEIQAAVPAVPPGVPVRSDDAVVLAVGRFGPEKNLHTLVAALQEVVARPGTVAILAGDGPLRNEVEGVIRMRALGGRIFTPGYVDTVWPLMQRAAVVVAIGRFEGRPNAVLEAMAAGRPLVVSDIAAHREILDADSALFVDPEDPGAVASAVAEVLEQPSAARRRAAAAREKAGGFSIQSATVAYDRVYRQILARRAAGTP